VATWCGRLLWILPMLVVGVAFLWAHANSAEGGEGPPPADVPAAVITATTAAPVTTAPTPAPAVPASVSPAPTAPPAPTPAPPAATPSVAIGLSPGSPGDSPFGSYTGRFAPLAQTLGIHDMRVFVRIDGTSDNDLQADENFVDEAISRGYDVLVQLADDCRNTCPPPSPDAYAAEVASVVSALPGVHEWSAWNEPNIGGPGGVSPELAATYYADAARVLQGAAGHSSDTLLAGEFASFNPTYVAAYLGDLAASGVTALPTVWSFHPYDDVVAHPDFTDAGSPATQTGNLTSTQTYAFAQFLNQHYAAAGQGNPTIWLTESGAWLDCPKGRPECAAGDPLSDGSPQANTIAQEQAAYEFLALANASPAQIARNYYYNWVGDGRGFDSGLLDAKGVPRPVACVLLRVAVTDCPGSTTAEHGNGAATVTPESATVPTLSTDAPVVGQPVSASAGTWTGTPTAYVYQWSDCTDGTCIPIAGATASAYTPSATDVGHGLSVRVIASGPWGAGSPADSAPTGVIG
jgi:hypothetical protein